MMRNRDDKGHDCPANYQEDKIRSLNLNLGNDPDTNANPNVSIRYFRLRLDDGSEMMQPFKSFKPCCLK